MSATEKAGGATATRVVVSFTIFTTSACQAASADNVCRFRSINPIASCRRVP